MLRRPVLPDSAFPSALDESNAIRSFYKTNLLYPAMGPAGAASIILRFSRSVRHLAIASMVVKRLRDYRSRYREGPKLVAQEPLLDPRVRNPDGYVERFVTSVRRHPLLGPSGDISSALRATADPSGDARRRTIDGSTGARRSANTKDTVKSLDTALLVRAFAVPNRIFSDLFDAGVLNTNGEIISNLQFLESEKPHIAAVEMITARRPVVPDKTIEAATPLVRMAVRRVARYHGSEMLDDFDTSLGFRDALTGYLLGNLAVYEDLPHPRFPHLGEFVLPEWPIGPIRPGDEVEEVNPQREWAFQRSEELSLALATPVLRGPVMASPVAPGSRLEREETESQSTTETTTASSARQSVSAESRQVISASAFTSALDNLTESGISDASAFSQQSTLLSTLNEERRTVIDTVARKISTDVERSETSVNRRRLGRKTKYRTGGTDPRLATTELAFQVVVPAEATVKLRDVGVAWCPRVPLPFGPLRDNTRRHQQEQRDAYVTQYYVPLPVGPALKSDVIREETFEFWIRGRKNRQKVDFQHFVPLYGDAFIDLNEVTVKHRNGTWDDAQELPFHGDIPYNYDDLEHAIAYLENLSLSADGQTLSGTGVLETHDPEYFNVSWLVVTAPVRSFTDETVAALAAFENAKEERQLKIQAVNSRAEQFGRMKRDELIEQYERTIDLRREAFRELIRRVCLDVPPSQQSWVEEVLSRCINWNDAALSLESEDMADLTYRELAPDHFMNTPGARFFLPIQKGAESLFFDTLSRAGLDYYRESAEGIRTQLADYRASIAEWVTNDAPELVLDRFSTEIVIGHHLEAVLSESDFANEVP